MSTDVDPAEEPLTLEDLEAMNEIRTERDLITYETDESLEEPRLREKTLKRWIKAVAESYGRKVGELAYQFCTDLQILETNQEVLNHDYFTDIITFDYSVGDVISGDMLISLETVQSNTQELHSEYAEELHRVIIHGVLHLCGLKDKSPEAAEEMRAAEDKALELLHELVGRGKSLFD